MEHSFPKNPIYSTTQAWNRAWKGFLPLRAIVMGRKGPIPLSPTHGVQNESNHPTSRPPSFVLLKEGNPRADLVFLGQEFRFGHPEILEHDVPNDPVGRPFIGPEGQLLDRMVEAMGLKLEQVLIANIVKNSPTENSTDKELDLFLSRQLTVIQPKVIVALGNFSIQTLLKSPDSNTEISELRGKFYPYQLAENDPGQEPQLEIMIMPTFHPSYLLKNPASKREAWSDLQQVAKILGIELPKR